MKKQYRSPHPWYHHAQCAVSQEYGKAHDEKDEHGDDTSKNKDTRQKPAQKQKCATKVRQHNEARRRQTAKRNREAMEHEDPTEKRMEAGEEACQAEQDEPGQHVTEYASPGQQAECLPTDPETQSSLPEQEEIQVVSHEVSGAEEAASGATQEPEQEKDFAMRYAETLLPPWIADVKPDGTSGAIGSEFDTWIDDEASLDDEPELVLDEAALERIAGKIWAETVADATSWISRERIVVCLKSAMRLESEYQKFLHRKELEERVL